MKRNKPDHAPCWSPTFKHGQLIQTPDGERRVEAYCARQVMLDRPVMSDVTGRPMRYWDEDTVIAWQG